MTVYKYPLQITDEQTVIMPKYPHYLTLQWVRGELCLYAVVKPDNPPSEHKFIIVATGQEIPNDYPLIYMGTVTQRDERLVWHVFEQICEPLTVNAPDVVSKP